MPDLPDGLTFRRWPGTGPLVESVWCARGPWLTATRYELMVPSGEATLQLCRGRPGRCRVDDGPARPNADVLMPVQTLPVLLEQPPGWSEYWGVQLQPWALAALWPRAVGGPPIRLDHLTGAGTAADLHALLDPSRAVPDGDRATALADWVRDRAAPLDRAADLVRRAVVWADRQAEPPVVSALAAHCDVAASTLGRAFGRVVGVSPKDFLTLRRFSRFAMSVVVPGAGGHAALSALSGYYDQSHAIRDFRRLTGVTPGAFRRRLGGIARLMQDDGKPTTRS